MKKTVFCILCILLIIPGLSAQSHSQIFSLEDAFKSPEALVELHLYDNFPGKTLPADISTLVNLEVLNILSNGLEKLPPEIGQLKKLKALYVSETKLKNIPPEIGELQNPEILSLTMNEIT